ncbi:MAG: 3'-5' exonuclease [Cytophagales bacterium]|nr:3'-5' exonuclease [Cytophagales bacterium]MDW8384008.1 3'-5' exonuclease [Flammeovirgaceae bacterium]
MKLHLKNPLAFFDLETTGVNVITDRIVEIAIIKVMPNNERITYHQLINPTIPIPPEATLIHGIRDQDVADKPTFREVAKTIYQFLEGCDLAGYNMIKFDIPLLVEEFLRCNINFNISKRKLIDAQKIFHLMEPRTLEAAYKFYCNKELTKAHSAEADCLATLEVLEAQLERYANVSIKDKDGNLIVPIVNDMEKLHELFSQNMVDLQGRMIYNEKNEIIFNFGKHKGKPVLQVLKQEPTYYDWIMKGEFALDTKHKLTEIVLSQLNQK